MMGDKGTWLYAMTKMEFPSMTTIRRDKAFSQYPFPIFIFCMIPKCN